MELKQVYIKTAKGQEEIQQRTYKLSASLRKLLIMVDGHSTAAEMIGRLSAMGDVTPALTELETDGFIMSLTPVKLPPVETPADPWPPVETAADASLAASTQEPQSERLLLQNLWGDDDATPASASASASASPSARSAPLGAAQPQFNLDKAKHFIRATLLAAMGANAVRSIDLVDAATTVEELRIELDAIRDMLPKALSQRHAEQIWKQLEPIMVPLASPLPLNAAAKPATMAASIAQPASPLDQAKATIRQILSANTGPNTGYWIDRIDAVPTLEVLHIELDVLNEMLPRIFSRSQAGQVKKQLEPILASISPTAPVAQPTFNLNKAKDVIRRTLLEAMGPTAIRRVERIDGVTTVEALRTELEGIHEMLPKVLSKRQAEQVWKQLEPILMSISLQP